MLIVCTHDAEIIAWTGETRSNASAWKRVYYLNTHNRQDKASAELQQLLRMLAADEPLCLSAHGNNTLIGDEKDGPNDWTWSTADIAQMLATLNPGYKGPILTRVCSKSVANFSAGLALQLETHKALNKVWVYGYNKAVIISEKYPWPDGLAKHADLQGTQVTF